MFDNFNAFDLRVAHIDNTDMLTVIYPYHNAGLILDNSYQVVKSVSYSETWNTSNMHDFTVMKDGSRALVLTKNTHKLVSEEKSKAVGFDGKCEVHEDGIKELDISGSDPRVVFAWNGTDHIGLEETTFRPQEVKKMCNGNWDIQ